MYDLKGSKKLLPSIEDRPIFEDREVRGQGQGLDSPRPRPTPRTSKTVLEVKDVLEAATSDNHTLVRFSSYWRFLPMSVSRKASRKWTRYFSNFQITESS